MNTGLHLVFIVCSAFFVLVFALYLLLQAAFILAWLRIPAEKESQKKLSTRLAVILPVRNEAANLEACLKSIAEQNYSPDLFELIVADDDSEDKTAEIVKAFIASGQIRNMKYIHLPGDPEVKAHKKRAIAAGIRQTDADLIVTTDGDCVSGKNWLRAIVTFYECEAPALIIGPVAFRDEQSLFEQMQTLEFAGLLLVTGASSALGIPLMCAYFFRGSEGV
jgi:cellulose synthase/poly-beta-1,6-N-acetylglucosamine synthase-like glycosyltransferase